MLKLKEKIKNNKIETIFALIVIVIILLLTIDFSPKEDEKSMPSKEKPNASEKQETIMVDIKGAVKNPGVFEMHSESRVIDVLKKAGGLTSDADTSMINLSKKVKDEMVITIYTKAEMQESEKECPPCECPEINNACITDNDAEVSKDNSTSDKTSSSTPSKKISGKISINTASLEELQTLDGIGETKAKAIIGYRETNGKFKSIEEIQNVSGIGESTYEKIKDDITI